MRLVARLRARLSAWYDQADKSLLTNMAFLAAIGLSAVLLVGAVGASWWTSTFAAAVEVNGRAISVGEARARGEIELFRLGQESARIRARVSAGTLASEQGNAILQQINDQATNVSSQLTSDMIDVLLVGQLAEERGVIADQAAIDAEWSKETSIPELRLLRRITIDIEDDPKTGSPSTSTTAAAQSIAESLLAEIKAGGDVAAIAKRESTDSFAADGGRIGWSTKDEDPQSDAGYEAAWALTAVGPTDVIKRADDQFVIFYVDQIRPSTLDADFEGAARDVGIDMALYKKMSAERALQAALSADVTAELLMEPVQQRDVSFVSIAAPQDGGMGEEVQVRHILYSPSGNSEAAAELDPADPAWAAAEAEAAEAYDLIANGTPIEELASQSDDTGSGAEGGLLAWAIKGTFVPEFDEAVWADGLAQGDLLGPIKTQFGYHVIQFEARRAGVLLRLEQLAVELAAAGADFDVAAEAAAKEIDGLTVDRPGFVVQYAINPDLSAIVWGLGDGEVSSVKTLGEQLAIIRVNAIENKPYTEVQRMSVEASGFLIWLDGYRSSARIAIDGAVVQDPDATPAP
uniref:peptidylprolyl isomerase n=2 Tax=Candidatus Limnocylindrus sp. TaxID=2802978 RepID=UPI00404B2A91